jgi:flagellar protein FliS
LNKKAGGEIAESLDALYVYMSGRLTQANIRNQPEFIQEVIKLMNDLKAAWEAIDQHKATAQVINNAPKSQQGAGVNRSLAYMAKV